MNKISKIEQRILCPEKDIIVENVDTFVCQSVLSGSCGVLLTVFTVPRGKLLYNISLYPYTSFVYVETTRYPSEFCNMDWAVLISGRRLEHINIMASSRNQVIHIDKKLRANNLLQVQIDLTNVVFPAFNDIANDFMIRVEGILADDRGGSGIYPTDDKVCHSN